MTFLSIQTLLIAAGLTIPTLLLLYFLKLRRKERKVASTLLWKKAVQDLQVNSPFQRLRRNLLLFLQLLILAAILFGLGNPVASFVRTSERNLVVLIDRSGSMKTVEADGRSRLEHAKAQAIAYLEGLKGTSQAMVISFADRADVVCTFTDDIRRLRDRIESIEAGDGPSRIGEALQLAVAFSMQIPTGENWKPGEGESAEIELFSDGRLADTDKQELTRAVLKYHRIGAVSDNAGIVAFDVRRDIERPGVVAVFAQVENFGPTKFTANVSLSVDGRLVKAQEVTLGPVSAATTRPGDAGVSMATTEAPSGQNLIFELESQEGGQLEIKLHRDDALMIDNAVVAPLDPPRGIRVLGVSDRPEVQHQFRHAFEWSLEIPDFVSMTTEEYEKADESQMSADGRSAFDLVVLDMHDTDRLWPGSYLFMGGVPKIEGIARDGEIDEQVFVNWRDDHPLLRYVPMAKVVVMKWERLRLPAHAMRLAEGENSTPLAFITDPGHRYVIASFDLLESNFFKLPAMVMFFQNAVSYLAAGGLTESGRLIRPGDTINAQVPPGATKAVVTTPIAPREDIDVTNRRTLNFARTESCGAYKIAFNNEASATELFAANVLDPVESLIMPADELRIGGVAVKAGAEDVKVNDPLWPHAVAAALVILLLEWWIYNKRVMI